MRSRGLAALALLVALASAAVSATDDAVRVGYAWGAREDCRSQAAVEHVTISIDPRTHRGIVRGNLRRIGGEPIRAVSVCFGDACAMLARGAVIAGDQNAAFEIDGLRGARADHPTVECSVLEQRAGA